MLTRTSIDQRTIDQVVTMALAEDAPWGDLTTQTLIPAGATASATLTAREPGVFSGAEVLRAAMTTLARDVRVEVEIEIEIEDGDRFEAGGVLARIVGPARAILQAERVALNLIQRMCGIATLTAAYVAAVQGTSARVVDTRKTTPGLRALERHAVRCGGGRNHRFSLSESVLVKDNHLAVLAADRSTSLAEALRDARDALPHTTHLEVEVDRVEQIEPVLQAGVDTIMLDNFTTDELVRGVALVAGRVLVEASGTITLETIAAVARTGVDIISVGALTHSVRSLDLGLDIVIDQQGDS